MRRSTSDFTMTGTTKRYSVCLCGCLSVFLSNAVVTNSLQKCTLLLDLRGEYAHYLTSGMEKII